MCGCLDESGVSLVFHSERSDLPENHVFAWNGHILRICGAPYGPKWKCFWLVIEYTPLDVWFKFGVELTFRSRFVPSFCQIGSSPQLRKTITDVRYVIFKIRLGRFVRVGPEILCTNFREIWTKSVGTGAKSVFWRKFKMAENLSRRKWAWPI